jgi:hypothetical protein
VLISHTSTKRSFVLFLGALVAAGGWLGGLSVTPADAGPATHLVITAIPDVRAAVGLTVTVEARDASNNIDTGFTGLVSLALTVPNAAGNVGSGFHSPPNAQSATAGTATFSGLQLRNAANGYFVTASSAGIISGDSNLFDVTALLVWARSVDDVRAGDPFTVTVDAIDAQTVPELAENFNGSVSLQLNLPLPFGSGSGFVAAPGTQSATAGTATFSGLQLLNAADGYSLLALNPGGSAFAASRPGGFDVTARTLVVRSIANVRAGDPFSVTVDALDAQAVPQVAENFNGLVGLSINAPNAPGNVGSGFASHPGHQSATAGTATFSNLQLLNAANGYVLIPSNTDGSANPTASNLFDVTARTLLVQNIAREVGPFGTAVWAGVPFEVVVHARDAQVIPQVAENYDGTVSLAVNVPNSPGNVGSGFASPPGTQIGGSDTLGSARFSDPELRNAANGYFVTASGTAGAAAAATPIAADSNLFDVTARTLVTRFVDNVRAGDPFTFTVDAFDAQAVPQLAENFNRLVALTANAPNAPGNVGSDLASAPGTHSASAGTVTFSALHLLNAADGYALTATLTNSFGLVSASSNSFDVTARTLVFRDPIPDVVAGDPFGATIDAFDAQAVPQLAENFDGTVVLIANVGVGGSGFAATPSQGATSGTAAFTGLTLNDPADGYTLTASSGATNPGTSNFFDVIGTAANQAPFAVDDALSATRAPGGEVASGTVEVLANDTDADDDVLEVNAFAATSTGGGAIDCTTAGACTYTEPDGPCVTSDSFEYTVTDGEFTDVGRVDVTIDCEESGVVARTISLQLTRHLIAEGSVNADIARCRASVPIQIQRRVDGVWVSLGQMKTGNDGSFRLSLPDRQGTYRARALRREYRVPPVVCGGATSATATHQH